jgi:EAL domain-containing protein (putative c-di-GMP-specific phosphodiesterase class I)
MSLPFKPVVLSCSGPDCVQSLWASVRYLRVDLMRSWRVVEQDRSRYYDFVAEANGKISQALTGTGFAAAKNLSWLSWTRIRYGALGLWDRGTETMPRQLRIIGEYGQQGTWGTLVDTCHTPELFPPTAATELIEFVLHFQPVFSLCTGRPMGAEALIRWNHPEQGCLSPARFLAVAEEVGLAVPISEWVIETACREAKTWQVPGEPIRYVNVNLSAQHLKNPGLVDWIKSALRQCDLLPEVLGLELVESTLIENQKSTIRALQSLRDFGVRTAIDDFGTGYSSLSYLKRFPINVLKIDRSFVHGVPRDVYDSAIASGIIAMAHDLNLTVVAEGVETRRQVQFLKAHQCDAVQGFLLSRPLPAAECGEFLRMSRRSEVLLELTA